MRIGMVTACYKPVINGVTRMVSLYKTYLEAAGHEVTIFTLGDPDPAGDEPGVVRSSAVPLGESGYYLSMRYSSEAQALMQQMDILHCHHLFMSVEMAHRYARCPIVYTNHTRYDLYTGTYSSLPQPAADALMRRVWPEFTDLADVVVTPSESVKKVMLEFGVRQPIEVIENGVDLWPFRYPSQPLTKSDLGIPDASTLFMYVGRLSMEKKLLRLIEQFAIAQDIVPNMHLCVIGGGALAAELPKLAADLNVADHIHFPGSTGYEEVANYLNAADAFVTASESEVHPLTVIEAMAAGLPVIAPASPGIVDTVVSGESGLLTNRPEGGLAAAMVGLALNDARREQMQATALHESERFDMDKTIEKTLELYHRLRETRPDLQRKREHGRWVFTGEKMQPVVNQLSRLLDTPDLDRKSPRKWRVGNWFDSNNYNNSAEEKKRGPWV
ncbi:MAG: glycosyltransferase family 4 protein [Chloroflexi bacterium]|nr:glycosyltransferase family 4 protein [Chloroflexota bacterium]